VITIPVIKMAWKSEWVSSEGYDHQRVTSTPVVPCSSANIDDKSDGPHADDSGYFTELKHALTKPSFAEQCVAFPPFSLEISEEESLHISTERSTCAVVSDSSTDCINQSLQSTDDECRLRLSDVTSVYASPDTEDRLTTIANTVSEGCSSIIHHSSCDSMHEKHPITRCQPFYSSGSSRVDFISRLSYMPHVVAVILCYVSDVDLCR